MSWCREEILHAHVLLAGQPGFEPAAWPQAARDREAEESARWNKAIRDLTRRIRSASKVSRIELLLVVIDPPYAAVSRQLGSGAPIPADLADVVARIVRASLVARVADTQ